MFLAYLGLIIHNFNSTHRQLRPPGRQIELA